MPRGGSKPGERRGRRAKGTPNKTMLVRVDRAAAEVASLKPGGKIYTLGKDRLTEIETRAGPNPSTLIRPPKHASVSRPPGY
jgi:hypothetical protein